MTDDGVQFEFMCNSNWDVPVEPLTTTTRTTLEPTIPWSTSSSTTTTTYGPYSSSADEQCHFGNIYTMYIP